MINPQSPVSAESRRRLTHDISWISLLKIAGFVLLCMAISRVVSFILILTLAVFVATALDPVVENLRRFMPKKYAVSVIAGVMVATVLLAAFFVLPSMYDQLSMFMSRVPEIKTKITNSVPPQHLLRAQIEEILLGIDRWKFNSDQIFSVATLAGTALLQVSLIFLFSIYLLFDGKRSFKWFSDFFSAPVRMKLAQTASECSEVVHHYMLGQLANSILAASFSFVGLTVARVPGAFTLAIIIGALDVIPVVGFTISLILGTLFALTVSPITGVAIFVYFMLYHSFQNYLVVPWLYSQRLKISPFVILLGLFVALTLGGVLAALAVLPVIASYPIIERIWLVKYLGQGVVLKRLEEGDKASVHEQARIWGVKMLDPKSSSYTRPSRKQSSAYAKSILIADDDLDISSTLEEVLMMQGYRVLVANNGAEAQSLLTRSNDVGLILLDMMMPIMSGADFLDWYKTQPEYQKTPVVFLSDRANQATTPGATEYLKKPIDLDELLKVVSKYMHSSILNGRSHHENSI